LRDSFYDAVNVWDYVKTVVRRVMNGEMENIWKESLMTKKIVLLRYLSEGSGEKQGMMPQTLTAGVPTYFQIGFLLNKNLKLYFSKLFWYGGLVTVSLI
jgi:hypothetical protein